MDVPLPDGREAPDPDCPDTDGADDPEPADGDVTEGARGTRF
ncbi:MAG TPA: hypothetical protein VEX67_11585 [Solirubrobacteraceae bacterium]|nr:hypothetical protein [Solirubrobacteraceae bacterium]